MAATYELSAQSRADKGKGVARKLRARSRVPAVLYGPGIETPRTLSLDAGELRHAITTEQGDRVLLQLSIEGEKGKLPAIVKDIQRHPVRQEMLHADLLAVDMATPIEIRIPLRQTGTMPYGVKNEGGVLEWIRRDLTIMVLPDKIPASIEVDLTELRLKQAIHAGDLTDEGYELAIPSKTPLCHVVPTRMSLEVVTDEEEGEAAEGEGVEGEAAEGEAAPAAEGESKD